LAIKDRPICTDVKKRKKRIPGGNREKRGIKPSKKEKKVLLGGEAEKGITEKKDSPFARGNPKKRGNVVGDQARTKSLRKPMPTE